MKNRYLLPLLNIKPNKIYSRVKFSISKTNLIFKFLIKNHPNKKIRINLIVNKLCDSMSWLNSYSLYYLYSAIYTIKNDIGFFPEEVQILQEHFSHLTFTQTNNVYVCKEELNVVDMLIS